MEENTTLYEVTTNEETEVTESGSKSNTGLAVLIGGVIGAGLVVGARKLKKMYDNHKAKKNQVVDSEFVEDLNEVDSDEE